MRASPAPRLRYPTPEHQRAAEAVVSFFSARDDVEAVLLINSCARGKASPDSCLDVAVLAPPEILSTEREAFEKRWTDIYETAEVFRELRQVGRFSEVHLDFIDGHLTPRPRDWLDGPDGFELEIGNYLVYSVPLWQQGRRLQAIQRRWLPYYEDALRSRRLALVRRYCLNNLDHIPLYVERGLCFQAFHRLYLALQEFLQGLFIARRTYPIAYDKWVREQVIEILALPEVYHQLVQLLQIEALESPELTRKAQELRALLEEYVVQ